MKDFSNLGEKIKMLRKAQGMTQAEFASELGVEPLHISNIERGKKGISFNRLKLVCKRFSVSIVDLMPINDFDEVDLKYELIDEIELALEMLDLSQVRLIKTMICALIE